MRWLAGLVCPKGLISHMVIHATTDLRSTVPPPIALNHASCSCVLEAAGSAALAGHGRTAATHCAPSGMSRLRIQDSAPGGLNKLLLVQQNLTARPGRALNFTL